MLFIPFYNLFESERKTGGFMETLISRPDTDYFFQNRLKFMENLGDDTITVLFSGTPKRKSADLNYPFYANRNFYYLTGIEEEGAVLIIKKHRRKIVRLILFIRAGDPLAERWTGKRLKPNEASEISKIYDVLYSEGYKAILRSLLTGWDGTVSVDRDDFDESTNSLMKFLADEFPAVEIYDVYPILAMQRMYKTAHEISLIKQAIKMTDRGIQRIYRRAVVGMTESQLAADFEYEIKKLGAEGIAFDSIVATGDNFNYLHYPQLNSRIKQGEMILLDVGASLYGMTSDISRSFPIDGTFNEAQKKIYSIVRACQDTAFTLIRPGAYIKDINQACLECAGRMLCDAGIIHNLEDAAKYFWHSVSHHLGLDVHDICGRTHILEKDMVVTVEPGLYIPEMHIGLRIEDDVLVTADGCSILSSQIARDPEDIEKLIAMLKQQDLHKIKTSAKE
jgi:Xaa-Pro aminopeptidase